MQRRFTQAEFGPHVVEVLEGGYYDRFRMNPDLDEVARDPVAGNIDFYRRIPKQLMASRTYGPGAPNYIAARSALTILGYRPIDSLARIATRTLVIGGARDTIAPFDEPAVRAAGNPRVEIETLDASHFEPYLEPHLSRNLALQVAFLASLGGGAKTA